MRVISQDGTIDVPYEDFVFSILNSGGGNFGIVAVKNVAEPPEVFMNSLIATYSSKEKAIKAMKMLSEEYFETEHEKTYRDGAYYFLPAFQFPKDDEVEV